jgi:hypothetical protein
VGKAPAFSGVKFKVISLLLGLNCRHICVPISISFLLSGLTRVTTITFPPYICTASPAFEEEDTLLRLMELSDDEEIFELVSEVVSKSIL